MPRTTVPTLIACAASLGAHAAEITIEPGPFSITHNLTATILPEKDATTLPAVPETWSDWTIVTIQNHGTKVAKNDLLVEFDAQALTRKIEDTRLAITSKSLELAQAEQELAHLQTTSKHQLESLQTTSRIAREELEYFIKTRRNAEERSADQTLDRAKQYLANQQEELRQLEKMYKADDLTEDTEEIILIRQKNSVASATFALEMEALRHKRTREVLLPREAVTLENQNRDATLALDQATRSIPRSIERKTNEITSLKTSLQRDKDNLADLEKDLAHMKITAPADGWFFHGLIENGRWTTGEITKSLAPGSRLPSVRPFATFIPAKSTPALFALTDPATTRALATGLPGKTTLPGREDLDIPTTIASLSPTPATDGKHTVLLHPTWPKDYAPAIGSTAEIQLVSYHKDSTISLPLKALHFDKSGITVSVKLANGKTERRPVRRGRSSGSTVEILEGLEKGQVVILPES